MLTDMIVSIGSRDDDGEVAYWRVARGSRTFLIERGPRGDWYTLDTVTASGEVLDVSGDLSGSLEYIDGLFR